MIDLVVKSLTPLRASTFTYLRVSVAKAGSLTIGAPPVPVVIGSDKRRKMEDQWSRSGDVSTEDLRVARQPYRSFFNRLLTL
jgi:hypothetical protein